MDEIYNEELPENVVVPLSNSGPLSVFKPSALSQYEVTSRALSLSEPKYKKVSQNEPKLKKFSQQETKFEKVSQNENKYKKLTPQEPKFNEVSQNESKYKKVSQIEIKAEEVSQNEKRYKEISQNEIKSEEVSQNVIKKKDFPQSETKSKGLSQSGLSTSITKALSEELRVKKEMMKRMLKTFRPGHYYTGIFKHFPPECQQNENWWCMDDDLPVCRDNMASGGATDFPPKSRKYAEVGQSVQCVQLCTAMPNHSGFAVTAQFELIILLTADLSRGPESELKPILVEIVPFMSNSD